MYEDWLCTLNFISKYLDLLCTLLPLVSYSLYSMPWKVNLDCDFWGTNGKDTSLCSLDSSVKLPAITEEQLDLLRCLFQLCMVCQEHSRKVTETSGTLMRLRLGQHAPFLVRDKHLEPYLSLYCTMCEF